MTYARKVSGQQQNRIMISQNVLNHRIDVPQAKLKVDGDNTDWADYTDALFVGSESQAQAAVRPAKDDDNLYFLVERLDTYLSDGDTVELYLGDSGSDKLDTNTLRLTVGPNGLMGAARFNGSDFAEIDAGGIQAAMTLQGTIGNDEDEDTGYLVELSLPRSLLKATNDRLQCHIVLKNQDEGGTVVEDSMSDIRWNVPDEWMTLNLG